MKAEGGLQNAEAAAPSAGTVWEQRRRVLILLAVCLGMPACVCRKGGVLRRGPLAFDGMRFGVGSLVVYPEQVGVVTVERDLVTLHVGELE